jgi:hypothetical protein
MQSGRRRDKRRAIRIACSAPVRIRTRTGWLEVRVIDLSRGGIRVAIPCEQVGVAQGAALLDVARRLGTILPERIEAVLGTTPELQRILHVVRIGKCGPNMREIELGCLHDRPLDDDDALTLGVVLPREGESWDQAERRHETLYGEQA